MEAPALFRQHLLNNQLASAKLTPPSVDFVISDMEKTSSPPLQIWMA